ncbi:MAG TPA: pyridoxal-phosphate dependent enzyme, partial [Nitrososphaerales archaeon]|nr:pyridoxal-phosphate dependent enzyme [Nitrososphaerales archaeon]
MPILRCVGCGHVQESSLLDPVCERCSSAVVLADSQRVRVEAERFEEIPLGVWRYSLLLPVVSAGTRVTLGEGGTPLLPARRLGAELGLENLLLKDESRNPTGSFIDRGATVLVSLAKSRGVKECTCVTTGNLGASLAAYCAKAGIAARV